MDYYAGTDVSLEQSSVCVVDAAGKIVCEAKVASEPDREHQKPWGMSQACAPAAVGSGPCASRIAVDRSTSSASGFSRYPTVFDALVGWRADAHCGWVQLSRQRTGLADRRWGLLGKQCRERQSVEGSMHVGVVVEIDE